MLPGKSRTYGGIKDFYPVIQKILLYTMGTKTHFN